MNLWVSAASGWWLQAAATLPDTIVTKQVQQPRDWFNTVSGIASILISIALLALCVGLIPAAWNFRKSYGKVNELLDRIWGDVSPIMRHASTIGDNLNYVTTSIRVDVQQVNQTIALANERLQQAVRETERRLQEFNALLEVVRDEASEVFVSTASTLRGVREGAATFRADALRGTDGARDAAAYEDADAAEQPEAEPLAAALEVALGDALERAFESGEPNDGDVDTSAPGGRQERPRIRPRNGGDAG
jgi:uncharacterized protein YoxC